MELQLRTSCGKVHEIHVNYETSIYSLMDQVREKTGTTSSFVLEHEHRRLSSMDTVQSIKLKSGDIIDVVMEPLCCRKPCILFYLPRAGRQARAPAINVQVDLTLDPSCHFTTLIPRPAVAEDGHSLCWRASVHRRGSSSVPVSETELAADEGSALVSVNGRDRSYLFWEFESNGAPPSEAVNSVIGYRSLLLHAEDAFLITSESEYEDWCHGILELFGLGIVEQDDFATFWAGDIVESGAVVVARIVPESEIAKIAELHVSATMPNPEDKGKADDVPVNVKRVYVSMVVGSRLSKEFEAVKGKLRRWKEGTTMADLPKELQECFPIAREPTALSVLEWGGMLMHM